MSNHFGQNKRTYRNKQMGTQTDKGLVEQENGGD